MADLPNQPQIVSMEGGKTTQFWAVKFKLEKCQTATAGTPATTIYAHDYAMLFHSLTQTTYIKVNKQLIHQFAPDFRRRSTPSSILFFFSLHALLTK
jgi:hypothetical protein